MQQKRARRWWDGLRPLNMKAVAQIVAILGPGFGEPMDRETDETFAMSVQEGATITDEQVARMLMHVHDFEIEPGSIVFHYDRDKNIEELQLVFRANRLDRRNVIFAPRLDHVDENQRKAVGATMRMINDNITIKDDCVAIMPSSGQFGVDANFVLCLGSELHELSRELHEAFTIRCAGREFRLVVV